MKKIIQFGFRNGQVPKDVPIVDCRIIPNPHSIKDPVARRHAVRSDPEFAALVARGIRYLTEYPVIGVGCLYGHDRSGAVAEEIEFCMDDDVEIEKQ